MSEAEKFTWEDRKTYYDRKFFVDKAGHVAPDGVPWATHHGDIVRDCAKIVCELTNPRSVLDCGCAAGALLYGFFLLDPTIRIAGIELSDFAVEHAVEEVKPFIQQGDISEDLPYDSASFDLVTCIDVFEHQHDYEHLMMAVSAVCRVAKNYVFVRMPLTRCVPLDLQTGEEFGAWIESLNPLPHTTRLTMIGRCPQIYDAWPEGGDIEHSSVQSRAFWIDLFAHFGFAERALPEEYYIYPNVFHLHSFDVLLFQRQEAL